MSATEHALSSQYNTCIFVNMYIYIYVSYRIHIIVQNVLRHSGRLSADLSISGLWDHSQTVLPCSVHHGIPYSLSSLLAQPGNTQNADTKTCITTSNPQTSELLHIPASNSKGMQGCCRLLEARADSYTSAPIWGAYAGN